MADVDVVARLQLRAEQFSSETQARFGEFAANAERAAQSARTAFVSSFAEVQKLAKNALDLPRTSSGSLDLSSEIAQLKQSAVAAEEKATALRELQAAALRAASSELTVTEAMRNEAAAAEIAAAASEKDAGATRQRILALEALQGELNRTASSTGVVIARTEQEGAALRAVTGHTGNATAAKQLLQHSIRSTADSYSAGLPPMMIFGEQIGRLSEAAQFAGGSLGRVGAFLGGPWGLIITGAIAVLGPMIFKLIEAGNEIDKLIAKQAEQATKAELEAHANDIWARSVDGIAAATRGAREEIDKMLVSQRQQLAMKGFEQQGAIDALSNGPVQVINGQKLGGLSATLAQLTAARAELKAATQALRDAPAQATDESAIMGQASGGQRVSAAEAEVARLQSRAATLRAAIDSRQTALGEVHRIQIDQDVEADRDAASREQRRYQDELDHLHTLKNLSDSQYEAERRQIEATHQAKLKAIKDEKAGRDRETGRTITSAQARSIAQGAGFQVNSADRTYAQQKALFDAWVAGGRNPGNPVAVPGHSAHEMGNALDIQKTAGATVASIRAAFAAEGVRLTKVFSEQGHWHVEWARDAAATADASAVMREAAAEARQLKQDTDALTQAFDPAAAAALDYAKALAEIDRLGAAGHLSFGKQLEYAGAARDRFMRASAKPLPSDFFDDGTDPLAGVADHTRDQAARHQASEQELARQEEMIRSASDLFGDLFTGQSQNIWANFQRYGQQAISDLATHALSDLFNKHVSAGLKGLLKGSLEEGGGYGTLGGSVFSGITGGKRNGAAELAGGVLGDVAGKALAPAISKAVGGALGKTLGGAAGPIGSILGGIAGDLIGGLFKKAQNSGAGVSTAGGNFSAGTAVGTSAALKGQASSLAGGVSSGLQKIADALGAQITGSTDVQIGTSNGNIHINTHGGQIGKKGSGDVNFGSDQEGAVKAAISDALTDGVLSGISDAAQRILKSGQDIDRALSKALAIESIPKDLKAMLDPVGAALDALNTKWKATVAALDEGGASAEQYAQAEKLYKLQLDQVKASTASASQGLKDFLQTLKIGSASPLSLRDQESAAKAALQPYLDTIAGGGNVDQAKYQSAAQSFLEIERSIYGSTQAFFDQFQLVQDATSKAISTIDNAVPITKPVADPFVKATADSTAKTADGVTTGNEIAAQQSDLLASMAATLNQLVAVVSAGSTGFVGGGRGFTVAA